MPSVSFPFMALGAFGDLPSAGACRDRIGHFRCPFLMRDREMGPTPAGRVRRSHEGARNHRRDGVQREADRRWLRRLDHSRVLVSLGLHGVLALGDTDDVLTRSNRLGHAN
jgi:hypothetical protein